MASEKRIRLSGRAQKDFKRLSKKLQERVRKALKELSIGTRKMDIKKLKGLDGREDLYRLRVGDYRIIYLPTGSELLIIRIDHRNKIYEFLD